MLFRTPLTILGSLLLLVLSIALHEFAHAWAADRLGDATPRRQGRLTLNPLAHFDPLGFLMLVLMAFGLARPAASPPDAVRSAPHPSPLPEAGVVDATCTGPLVGTPAYMAPEQWTGAEVGPAADQFAFCVAFWEALYGRRPFAGETVAALAFAIARGRIAAPPKGRRVPRWLHRIVRRGLATAPGDRWPSMEALLDALARGQDRARLRAAAAVVGALALAGAGAEGYRRYERAQKVAGCEAVGRAYVSAWDEAARERVRTGLVATGVPHATTTADRVLAHLDARADDLRRARTETCLDATVRKAWSEDLAARSLWCLDERRVALETLSEELARAAPEAVHEAVAAAAGLPRAAPCRDADLLERLPPPPADPASAARVRRTLSRAATLEAMGRYDEALSLARRALDDAHTFAWPPLVARARFRIGSLLERTAAYDAAETMLQRAYYGAMHAGAFGVAVDAAARLAYTVGYEAGRYDDGIFWGRQGELAEAMLGGAADPLRRAGLLICVGDVHYGAGELDEARRHFERALEIREGILGSDHPMLAGLLNNLAAVDLLVGDYDGARRLQERALELRERTFGPEHPAVAQSLNNIAAIFLHDGDFEAARAYRRRAFEIRERTLGPDHPNVADSLFFLGQVHEAEGDYDEARRLYARSVDLWTATLGEDHPFLVSPLIGLATTALAEGDPAAAVPFAERAVAIGDGGRILPADLAAGRFALARALWDAPAGKGRDRARALDEARKAADLYRTAQGREKELAEIEAWLAAHRPK